MNSKNKKIYFRLDAGGIIGFGHYYRCYSIAIELEKIGVEPIFVIRKRPSLEKFQSKFKILWLPLIEDAKSEKVQGWINRSIDTEIEELIQLVLESKIVFIDHYGLDFAFHERLKKLNKFVVGFKDYDNFQADYSLEVDYRPKIVEFKKFKLQGLRYLPLNSKIQDYKAHKNNIKTIPKKIGVYLGGIKEEFVLKACDLFLKSKISFTRFKEDIFSYYQECELFIGAFGLSFFERGYLEVSQMNFVIAENQESFAELVISKELGVSLGNLINLGLDQLIENLNNNLVEKNRLKNIASNLVLKIDEHGASRIAARLSEELKRLGELIC
ncbi:MAG: hypothetical protein L6Q33_07865 [Bacteriovoracaceae bacterium]|nr:hypothetical protein [Bacteriovoracaceae bacterium]